MRNRVRDRVLHQRLQHQPRYLRVQHLGRDLAAETQAIAQPHLFDADVAIDDAEFLAQRGVLLPRRLQAVAQQTAELHQHAVGGVDVVVDHLGDRIERVEQEVRIELRR